MENRYELHARKSCAKKREIIKNGVQKGAKNMENRWTNLCGKKKGFLEGSPGRPGQARGPKWSQKDCLNQQDT